jgi:MFS family permease
LFVVSAAFGLGFSGLLPAYVIAIREYYPVKEANWRVPTIYFAGFLGMAAGGWGAGALFDHFGYYLPAFAVGIGFNIADDGGLGFKFDNPGDLWNSLRLLQAGQDGEHYLRYVLRGGTIACLPKRC